MGMKKTAFFTDERTFWHSVGQYILEFPVGGWVQPPSGASHAESPESKRRFKNLLVASGLADQLAVQSANPATEEELYLVHDPAYVANLQAVSDAGGGDLAPPFNTDTPVGPGTYEIAKLSAGLAIQALEDLYSGKYRNAYSLSRPPGHHATANQAMGFCYFNNIAVAIETVKKRHGLGRVAVIDWDVHHGNGQQDIYYERDDVLTISLHQDRCFPNDDCFSGATAASGILAQGKGAGKGYNINLPFYPGSGEEIYLYAFDTIIAPAIRRYKPEVIIVACGFDANAFDPLGRILLYSESYRKLTAAVMGLADEVCEGRVLYTHEGGYAESYVPFCGVAVMETLSNIRTEVEDPLLTYFIAQQPDERFNQFHKEIIDEWRTHFLGG